MIDMKDLVLLVSLAASGQSVGVNVSLVASVEDGPTIVSYTPENANIMFSAISSTAKVLGFETELLRTPNAIRVRGFGVGSIQVFSEEGGIDKFGYFDNVSNMQVRAMYKAT